MALFRRVTRGHWPFFLDSSLRESDLARYSFLGSDPCGWFRTRGPDALWQTPWSEGSSKGDPLRALGAFLEGLPWATAGDPVYPFLGGCVGYFSYDLGRHIERIPDGKAPDLQVPDIHLAVYPRIYVVDHIWGETFVIAPRSRIAIDPAEVPEESTVPSNPDAIETLSRDEYVETIREAKRAISEGEIFQVNLSHRVVLPIRGTAEDAYARLRTRTPSSFGGYLDAGDHRILSASPERFLRVRGRQVETRPPSTGGQDPRAPPGHLPGRVHHGSPQATSDGDHRTPRAAPPRRVQRLVGLHLLGSVPRLEYRDPHRDRDRRHRALRGRRRDRRRFRSGGGIPRDARQTSRARGGPHGRSRGGDPGRPSHGLTGPSCPRRPPSSPSETAGSSMATAPSRRSAFTEALRFDSMRTSRGCGTASRSSGSSSRGRSMNSGRPRGRSPRISRL